ncbi:uncharacterized protein MYCFIDRAFT_214499 [Pseudocercospora fijiensis CIRAD86]|uniref:Carboxylesterase type B domain-containing protein n=1 Tax=Pseudocercospora fijiensis (strain CIRAD86) TaxID=383855 RepID=M3B329_PSEFD|nr:uncharacterized protein MYCFIDRAFT_214499 [Pseudocercospora fijiensis CIRAD86]EME83778.1 hypothetical protein MYCFIDRAFT_214499 [Pseudocercospora fijiensis CIRAD86]
MDASEYASICPQNSAATATMRPTNQTGAAEDCLFLNVWTPNNATSPMPVFVWIHGGGYGGGSGIADPSELINTNGNNFVAVTIQYRLGAFGFLSSDEVYRKGAVNAGLLDQQLALQWVQQYIHAFNGDPTQVTIGGVSAGGGSVMLQGMAYGGSQGTQLFRQTFAASPFLPMQYGYNHWVPTQSYYALASAVGCNTMKPYGANGTQQIFECLLDVSSEALINASATISQSGSYGTWAFLPVTDGSLVQDLPSRQLARSRVNGVNALIGNNANEGTFFTPSIIHTEDDLVAWLHTAFPLFDENDIAKVLYYYPTTNVSTDPKAPLFATSGDRGPTALNQSSVATGQQQRADNIYAETTFVCPAYWLAEAYSGNAVGGKAFKYQFSLPPALHGFDTLAYLPPPGEYYYISDFNNAFQKLLGNFIVAGNPSISNEIANGVELTSLANLTAAAGNFTTNAASHWPAYTISEPFQIDLNTTCGSGRTPYEDIPGVYFCSGPGTFNDFRLVNAYTWEGGRGMRCDFWRAMGELVPE